MTRTHRYHGRADRERLAHPMSMLAPTRHQDAGSPLMLSARVAAPPTADRELMASLAIDFDAGAYRFDGMRFDCLTDAVGQARFAIRHQEDAGGR